MDVLRMLELLHDLVVDQPRTIAGGLVWGLDKEEVAMQIAKIRASLPAELKQAAAVNRESEKILERSRDEGTSMLDQARKESDRMIQEATKESSQILEQAEIQKNRMVTESEVLRLARAEADEMRNNAARESQEIRRGSESYAYEVLTHLENVTGKVMNNIERGKMELRQFEEANLPIQEKMPREKARV